MQFRLLGPLEVSDEEGARPLGGRKQRVLLAALVLQPNQVVGVDRLIDLIWGEAPPETARNTAQAYVARLRKALDPGRIDHRSGGYVLTASPDEVDALRFEALLDEAHGRARTDASAAASILREALALWRGPALDDLSDQPSLQPEIARLEELRLAAIEERIGAELELGRHGELVPELETLVGRHPLRERLWAHLILALYRSGRQADALGAYRRARELLADELGIDPSPELQRLHERVLRQDRALEAAGEPLRGYRLLEQIGAGFFGTVHRAFQPQVGREVAVKVIHPRFVNEPEFIRRFEAEAQFVARLEHPHIVPLYDFWREPDGAYLVMRYLRGGSLREALGGGPLAPEQAARTLDQVALALATAHREGVVHRDVKPANVLFDEDGNAYLSDFGIAKDLAATEATLGGGTASPLAYYLAPEEIRAEPATPATDVYGLGILLYEALVGRHPFADTPPAQVLQKHLMERVPSIAQVRPDVPAAVDAVIERATAKDPKERYPSAPDLAAAFREALAPAARRAIPVARGEARNPYKGLRPFLEADAADFFGREALTARLLDRMRDAETGGRFVAVVGASGSGKSSVVRAGLVPALKRGALPGSERWFVVEMVPGRQPFEELAAALTRVAVDAPAGLVERLERDPEALVSVVDDLLPGDRELLVVIDQFEEVFTLTEEDLRPNFLACLVAAATDAGSRIRLVVTLRGDFYDRPLSYPLFGDLLGSRTEAVTPLSAGDLERAVSGPAERVGVEVEPALVAAIVADVAAQPAALPLLQYALTELFDRREDSTLTVEAYRVIGGASGALARRAEEIYGRLNEAGREAARQLFLRLVSLGEEGSDDTRRRVLRAELTSLDVDREAMDTVIDTLGARRLLAFDRDPATRGPTVEVAHEALLREWGRLRGWIEASRDDLRAHRSLAAAAAEWAASGRDPSFLLRGARLARFEGWAGTSRLALTGDEGDYLGASLERRRQEVEEERTRQAREARLERRSLSRLRALVAVLSATALLASGLTAFAFTQRREAQRQRDLVAEQSLQARARELVLFSIENLESDPQLSLLLALEAVERTAGRRGFVLPEAADAVHWALQEMRVQFPATAPVGVRSGPDTLRGVFNLPLEELVSFAERQVGRGFTSEECRRYIGLERCPPPPDLADLSSLRLVSRPASTDLAPPGPTPLAGTEVRVATFWDGTEFAGWQAEAQRFEDATGIQIINVRAPPEALLGPQGANVDADILFVPTVGDLPALWRAGALMDLGAYLDMEQIRRDYAPHLLRLVTVGEDGSWPSDSGALVAGWGKLAVKSLVWYPPPEFQEAGYRIPRTWDELIALSDRIVADGGTPWCFGIESGDVTGWPATDWVEELLLRTAGPEVYDRWVAHEIPFTHPAVRRAVAMMGRIAFTPGYVSGGGDAVVRTPFWAAQGPMFRDPPGCWLHRQGSFAPVDWPRGRIAGEDSAAFPFPPMSRSDPPALLGAGDVFTVLSDRPEVREFVRFLMSPEFGEAWAAMPEGGFVASNLRFNLASYGSEVTVAQAEAARAALETDTFRFDGSDLMPFEVGSEGFWSGMVEYLSRGPQSVDSVLKAIEESWPGPP